VPETVGISHAEPKTIPIICNPDSEITFTSQVNPLFVQDLSEGDVSEIYIDDDGDAGPTEPPDLTTPLTKRFDLTQVDGSSASDADSEVWGEVTLTKRTTRLPDQAKASQEAALGEDEQLGLPDDDDEHAYDAAYAEDDQICADEWPEDELASDGLDETIAS
jgi:hypothetical protein